MPQERAKQEVTRFLGVNLRNDRANLADEDLAKAINADLPSRRTMVPGWLCRSALMAFARSSSARFARSLRRLTPRNRVIS